MGTTPSTASSGPRPVEFRDYWQALRLRWFWVFAGAVLGAVLGWTAGAVTPSRYEASTSVLLSALSTDPLAQLDQRNSIDMSTERQVAGSRQIAERTLTELGDPGSATVDGLLANLSVVVAEDTRVLRFTYEAGDPDVAAERANAFAMAYLDTRQARGSQIVRQVRESAERRLELLTESLATAESELDELDEDDPDDEAAISEVRSRITALSAQQLLAQTRLLELPADSLNAGSVISPAVPPSDPSGLPPPLLAVLGLLLGTTGGVVVALFLRSIDPWARDGEQVNEALGTASIGFVPDPHPHRRAPIGPEVAAGPLHRVANTIDGLLGHRRPRIVTLVDTGGDVATDIAVPIAAGLAQRQRTIVVVGQQRREDTDLTAVYDRVERGHHASASTLDYVERTRGGRPDVADLTSPAAPDAHVEAIAEVIDQYDVVVSAVPTIDESTAALDIAGLRDVVLVPVVRLGTVRLDELQLLRRDLAASGASVLGSIIVGPKIAWGRTDLQRPAEPGVEPLVEDTVRTW